MTLRQQLIKLAQDKPELRRDLVPLLKTKTSAKSSTFKKFEEIVLANFTIPKNLQEDVDALYEQILDTLEYKLTRYWSTLQHLDGYKLKVLSNGRTGDSYQVQDPYSDIYVSVDVTYPEEILATYLFFYSIDKVAAQIGQHNPHVKNFPVKEILSHPGIQQLLVPYWEEMVSNLGGTDNYAIESWIGEWVENRLHYNYEEDIDGEPSSAAEVSVEAKFKVNSRIKNTFSSKGWLKAQHQISINAKVEVIWPGDSRYHRYGTEGKKAVFSPNFTDGANKYIERLQAGITQEDMATHHHLLDDLKDAMRLLDKLSSNPMYGDVFSKEDKKRLYETEKFLEQYNFPVALIKVKAPPKLPFRLK